MIPRMHTLDMTITDAIAGMSSGPDDARRCCDLPTSREWLRMLAGNLALLQAWWVVPMVVAHLLVRVADLVQFWRHGQTSVLYPVLRGGADYSARAVLADRNPMVCGGAFAAGVECGRYRSRTRAHKVVAWSVPRRRVLTSVRVSSRGHVACFDPGKVTA